VEARLTGRRSILLVYFLLGAYAVCAQATLLRETQVILFGSELSWGLVLACWLAGVAAGARAGGSLTSSDTRAWRVFAASNLSIPLFVVAEVLFLRVIRSVLGSGPGEYVGAGNMLLVAAAATVPVSVWIGLAFPAAAALLARRHKEEAEQARSVGWVYLVESAGSLVGGVLFSFAFVETLDAFTLVVSGGAVLASATAFLAYRRSQSRASWLVPVAIALGAGVLVLSGAASKVDDATVGWRWRSFARGLELIQSADSKYQNIALGRLADQYSLYTNGTLASNWPDDAGFAIEAHLAACQHPMPRRMLVLGGGAEGLVKELLRHRPERLDYVTLDSKVFELTVRRLPPPDSAAISAPQTRVHYMDVRRFVKSAGRLDVPRYDLVVLEVSEPASALEARMYTEEFFAELSGVMATDAVLAFSLAASAGSWSPGLAAYVGSVVGPLRRVYPEVVLTFGDPMRVFAATNTGVLATSGESLAERYRERSVSSPYFDPIWFRGASDLLDPGKRMLVERALSEYPPSHYNTDVQPVTALYHMRMWMARSEQVRSGGAAPQRERVAMLDALLGVNLGWVVAVVFGITLLVAATGLRTRTDGLWRTALVWSVGTTGFASMAVEIVLLYTLQVQYGYVYAMLGLVVGTFMFGLVLGSLFMNRLLHVENRRENRAGPGLRAVLALDVVVMVFAAALIAMPGLLRSFESDSVTQISVFCLVVVAGILGGVLFPLAASAWLRERSGTGRAAAAVDASDHLGGCIGALATGVVLVPVLGITGTCLVIVVLKALSALLVYVSIAQRPIGRTAAASGV